MDIAATLSPTGVRIYSTEKEKQSIATHFYAEQSDSEIVHKKIRFWDEYNEDVNLWLKVRFHLSTQQNVVAQMVQQIIL